MQNINGLLNSIFQFIFCNIFTYKKNKPQSNKQPSPPSKKNKGQEKKKTNQNSDKFMTTWLNPEGIKLGEIRQILYVFMNMWNLKNK